MISAKEKEKRITIGVFIKFYLTVLCCPNLTQPRQGRVISSAFLIKKYCSFFFFFLNQEILQLMSKGVTWWPY